MSSLKNKTITVFGGTGFVGRHLIAKLASLKATIYVVTSSAKKAYFLKPYGAPGQITPVSCALTDTNALKKIIEKSDYVVNLIGALHETKTSSFDFIHHKFPEKIAQLCEKNNIQKFVHISAIGSDKHSKCRYLQTKALGEEAILKKNETATILRPSLIFGDHDAFFHLFARLLTNPFIYALPVLINGGRTKFQPVYVLDVVDAIIKALDDTRTNHKTYELGGANIYNFKELLLMIKKYSGGSCFLFSVPLWVSYMQASLLQYLPGKLLTPDQVTALKTDNIVHNDALKLEDLNITPSNLDTILPSMLIHYKKQ